MKIIKPASLILFVSLFFASGCDFPRTASEKSPLWGGYKSGKEYKLLRDVFIMEIEDGMEPKRLALCPEGMFMKPIRFHDAPHTIEEYLKNPDEAVVIKLPGGGSYKVNVTGVVRTGTTLKCTRVRQHRGLNLWYGTHNQITVYAKLSDGEHRGTEVDLTDVSDHYKTKDGWLRRPDQRILGEY